MASPMVPGDDPSEFEMDGRIGTRILRSTDTRKQRMKRIVRWLIGWIHIQFITTETALSRCLVITCLDGLVLGGKLDAMMGLNQMVVLHSR
jgi:hypothetical protein